MEKAVYDRVLLKLSGEALASGASSLDADILTRIAADVAGAAQLGVQIGIVIGGGNIFRGARLGGLPIERVTGDQMGMLATMINGLALRDALEQAGARARLFSALELPGLLERYDQRRVQSCLSQGEVLIFSAGTGNPFFTTDTAACLRAVEMGAEVMLKATQVDGVYDRDPNQDPQARFYPELSYDQAIAEQLQVMDLTAICLARANALPMHIFNLHKPGTLLRVLTGKSEGSKITA